MRVTYTRPLNGDHWFHYQPTEKIANNSDPAFSEKVFIPYLLLEKQEPMFELYSDRWSWDSEETDLTKLKFLGYAECKLAELLSAGKVSTFKRFRALDRGSAFYSA